MMPGIWRTGVAAVVLTIVFGAIVAGFAVWTSGEDSDFAVPDPRFTETWIIPQIPVGSADGNRVNYTTVIQIANVHNATVSVKGNFYKQAGGASDVSYAVTGGTKLVDGVLRETSIPAGGILVVTASPSEPIALNSNWGTLEATGNVSISTLFEIRGAAGELSTRVSVPASRTMSRFVVPRIWNAQSRTDVAFAIANASPVPANVSASLRTADGEEIATKTFTIAPRTQTARFIGELFGDMSAGSDTTHSSVIFDGGATAQLGAIAISYEGPIQTGIPVIPLFSNRN
jgi:hypothetical protein